LSGRGNLIPLYRDCFVARLLAMTGKEDPFQWQQGLSFELWALTLLGVWHLAPGI
jgi:hypothetical protein